MTLQSGFVSVVVPVANGAAYMADFLNECLVVLQNTYRDYELIIVDDASTDDTAAIVGKHLQGVKELRLVRLARRFGPDVAAVAGLDTAIGDTIVLMRADRDPPAEIPALVERCRTGVGVVTGVAIPHGDGLLTRVLRGAYHLYTNRVLGLSFPRYGTTFQALSRAAVSAVTRIRAKCPTFPVLASQVGYGGITYEYRPLDRAHGQAEPGLLAKIDRGLTVLVTSSISPLRMVSYFGVAVALLNLLYAGYVVGVNLVQSHVAAGWTTLSLQISGMFFCVFLVLVVVCEYVGRTLGEATNKPLYHVLDERNGSDLLQFQQRRNISA
ncbi:MAG: glycosyltransferase [Bacteroidales bacterium]|nr:glycosyltransferase [Bacteroidales bacterium]